MPETSYLLAVMAIGFVITFALRALPFAALAPLRRSALVARLAVWMPAGVLAILAASTLRNTLGQTDGRGVAFALAGVAVTAGVHLLGGRRTLLSVVLGTSTYVALVSFL
ncbi:branched-chain amino acid exporter BrnE [Pseudonocardia ailaonensis]|uniref:Branched-chain amino acid exporter BrnE n=1 Tax=Pseudonocardia ailaonensis TaxID=367279 RepID=A0ABN2N1H4_9PSEU